MDAKFATHQLITTSTSTCLSPYLHVLAHVSSVLQPLFAITATHHRAIMAHAGPSFPLSEATKLLQDARFTDFTICTEDATFPVHRMIIYQKSPYFRAILDDDFKEKAEATLTLADTTSQAVATTILFCYTNILHETIEPTSWPQTLPRIPAEDSLPAICTHLLKVYTLADRLLMSDLKLITATRFLSKLTGRKWAALEDTDTLEAIVEDVYKQLPESDDMLRPLVTGWLVSQTVKLLHPCKELRDLVMRKDGATYLAAVFVRLKQCHKWEDGVVVEKLMGGEV